ncbi:MAG: ATP-binding protein [Verrucomicrobiota bacterium]
MLRTQETYTFIDGKEHKFNVVKTKALDHEGNKIGVLAMAIDTTAIDEHHRQIDDLREANETLDQKLAIAVESATAAEDSAHRANLAKNAFLTTMSHEMRTPLNGIIGMTDMLMETALESDQREMLSTVELSGQSLLQIVNDILDYTNIEACSGNYDTDSIILREEIESAIDAFSGSNNPNDLNISYWIEPSIPEVITTNSSYLYQILHRLIDNAIKFTQSGNVEISCAARRLAENRSEIRINISDTGIGIPQDKLRTIFDSFSQADSSNTRRYGGTGIGLAIARKTAQRMGGDITVESEVDRGSTFKASFEVKHAQTHAGPAFEISPILQEKYVLIAEDDPISQDILNKYLTQWGAKTEIASNWKQASHLLSSFGRYDLVCACESLVERAGDEFENALYLSGIERVAMRLKHGSKKDDEPWALSYASPIKGKFLKEICETLLAEETLFDPNIKLSQFADDRPLKILLAEDNKMNQKVVTIMGQSLGYDISIASSGREAIEAVNNGNFDLVLMDIQMPDMDGLEATRIIRSSTTLSTQPYIVAVTSSALEESRKASERAGMNAFAIKPLIRDTMVKHLIAAHQSIHGPN